MGWRAVAAPRTKEGGYGVMHMQGINLMVFNMQWIYL